MVAVVAMTTALFTPVAVLRCWGLPCHHGGLVIRHRLHHTVLGLRLVLDDRRLVVRSRLLVVGHRSITGGCITIGVVLAGNAGTDQTAGTGTDYCAMAASDMVADGCTGYCANTRTQHGVEIIRLGYRCQTCETACQQRKACQFADFYSRWREKRGRKGQNTWCLHGVVGAVAHTAKRSGLSPFNAAARRSMTG